ncbi:50S ribosomal protein L6 [archaeon]|nr:50S ribosomal protein L6 [archaeon]
MKEIKEFIQEIIIPKDITLAIENYVIKVKGPKGENERRLFYPGFEIKKIDNKVTLKSNVKGKKSKKIINTYKAHIQNLINGVTEGFIYKLKICSGHFPMTVSIEGNNVIIKNFFGEKVPRKSKILEDVKVNINGDIITVESCDKEKAGQVSANLEKATRRAGFDRRIFGDGIYIFEKSGKEIK